MSLPTAGQLALQSLRQRQSLPLAAKVQMSKLRIRQWYEHFDGMVYIAFSGGKDSRVLLRIVRSMYPNVPAVFCDTGLEYPEIRAFVKTFDNVTWLKPKMGFKAVIEKYGYPVVSKEVSQKISEVRTTKSEKLRHKRLYGDDNPYKSGKIPNKWQRLIPLPFGISHKCCDVMKKRPSAAYGKESGRQPILGTMVSDSHARKQKYLRSGQCNSYEGKVESMPLSFWTEADIWAYIRGENISYCPIYDMGYDRTGCMFCMFGVHMEGSPNRFQRMEKTHPKQWKFCMEKLGLRQVLEYIRVPWRNEPTLFDK